MTARDVLYLLIGPDNAREQLEETERATAEPVRDVGARVTHPPRDLHSTPGAHAVVSFGGDGYYPIVAPVSVARINR